MTLLSAGTPMFLMGEEIGATNDFTYGGFLENREDLLGQRQGEGRYLFRFYRDLIRLRLRHHTFSTPNIEVLMTHNADRLLAFYRWKGPERYLVVATLSDTGWPDGYALRTPAIAAGQWREIFCSDAAAYGGDGLANPVEIAAGDGEIFLKVPARGFVVLRHMPQS
jgi:1,4-alpha-glucan branching enzyme